MEVSEKDIDLLALRRYMVPEEYYASAPCIDDAAAITEMGGKKGKYIMRTASGGRPHLGNL